MSRQGALDAIVIALASVTSTIGGDTPEPLFQSILRSEPQSAPAGERVAAFWYAGEASVIEQLASAGDIPTEKFTVACYWRVVLGEPVRETLELEVWNAAVSVRDALNADPTLTGNVTLMSVDKVAAGYTQIGGATYRSLLIPVRLIE